MSSVTSTPELVVDSKLAAAVDQAREVLSADIPADQIGKHIAVVAETEFVATHLFTCLNPGYVGWNWAVSVTRAPESDDVTVDETVLLPGEKSLLAPAWLPWDERVQPGDLGAGDVLPTLPDDLRLEPGYTGSDIDTTEDDQLIPLLWELGLGRVRVLSVVGRDEAATRWAEGDSGPNSPIAKGANHQCVTCGFLIAMGGPMGQAFGLCANEFSPSDGSIVTLDHGCGAHSDAEPEPVAVPVVDLIVDDRSPDNLDTAELTEAELAESEPAPEPDTGAEPASEPEAEAAPELGSEAEHSAIPDESAGASEQAPLEAVTEAPSAAIESTDEEST
ncbi:MAG: DUF3027 domain-containing protein [Actinobacteria bacterium]|nr:DUF3027 domain-containing protein [Actinomycetota bacterium]